MITRRPSCSTAMMLTQRYRSSLLAPAPPDWRPGERQEFRRTFYRSAQVRLICESSWREASTHLLRHANSAVPTTSRSRCGAPCGGEVDQGHAATSSSSAALRAHDAAVNARQPASLNRKATPSRPISLGNASRIVVHTLPVDEPVAHRQQPHVPGLLEPALRQPPPHPPGHVRRVLVERHGIRRGHRVHGVARACARARR